MTLSTQTICSLFPALKIRASCTSLSHPLCQQTCDLWMKRVVMLTRPLGRRPTGVCCVCVCVCVNPKNSSLTSSILEFWFTGSIWRDVTAQVTLLLPDRTLGSRLDFYDPVSPFPVNNEHKALIDTDSRWSRCTERYHAILGREPKYTKSRQNFKTIFACELAGCFFFFLWCWEDNRLLFFI